MKKLLLLFALFFAAPALAHDSQGRDSAPRCRGVDMLAGECGSSPGDRVTVTDATSSADCSGAGGGSAVAICTNVGGGAWVAGGGGSGASGGLVGTNEFARRQGGTYTIASPTADQDLVPSGSLITDGPDAQLCWSVTSATTVGLKITYSALCAPTTVAFWWLLQGQHAEAGNAQFDFSVWLDDDCDAVGAAVVTGSRVNDYVVPTGTDFTIAGSTVVEVGGTTNSCIYLRGNEDLKGSAFTLTGSHVELRVVEYLSPTFKECVISANDSWVTRSALAAQCLIPTPRVLELMHGGLIHNRGQTAGREIELPVATLGDNFTAIVLAAFSLCLDPNGTEDILGLATGGNKICSSTIGSAVTCTAVKDSGGGGIDWVCTGSGFTDGGP